MKNGAPNKISIKPKMDYFLRLEDDIITIPEYTEYIYDFMMQNRNYKWFSLQFYTSGAIGLLYKTQDLPVIYNMCLLLHRDTPIDWILTLIHMGKSCRCNNQLCPKVQQFKWDLKKRRKTVLFQHQGLQSSLRGKITKSSHKSFRFNEPRKYNTT